MIDRAELTDRGLCDLLSRRGLTDVSIDEREVRYRREAGLGKAERGCDDVIAAIQKCLDNGCSDALRGAGYDDCLFVCHILTPVVFSVSLPDSKVIDPVTKVSTETRHQAS